MARPPSERLSARMPEEQELNLAPIMNVVMILIPLLLVSASFLIVATLEVHSPQGQNVNPSEVDPPEEVPVPRVLVAITENGFTVSDLRQSDVFRQSGLSAPIPECHNAVPVEPGQVAVTVCTNPNASPGSSLLERLDYRGLYNRLVEVYRQPEWTARWDESNSIINIVADREVPVEVVIRTMDVARFFLESDHYSDEVAFRTAPYRRTDDSPLALFQAPVLLLPRAAAD